MESIGKMEYVLGVMGGHIFDQAERYVRKRRYSRMSRRCSDGEVFGFRTSPTPDKQQLGYWPPVLATASNQAHRVAIHEHGHPRLSRLLLGILWSNEDRICSQSTILGLALGRS